jgi:hypothetical protein
MTDVSARKAGGVLLWAAGLHGNTKPVPAQRRGRVTDDVTAAQVQADAGPLAL